MAIEPKQVVEALSMVTQQHLDIRTITLGLSLRGCVHEDIDVMAQRVYDRLTTAAKDLVPCAEQLEREFGIPIIHKRIAEDVVPHPSTRSRTSCPFAPRRHA